MPVGSAYQLNTTETVSDSQIRHGDHVHVVTFCAPVRCFCGQSEDLDLILKSFEKTENTEVLDNLLEVAINKSEKGKKHS